MSVTHIKTLEKNEKILNDRNPQDLVYFPSRGCSLSSNYCLEHLAFLHLDSLPNSFFFLSFIFIKKEILKNNIRSL